MKRMKRMKKIFGLEKKKRRDPGSPSRCGPGGSAASTSLTSRGTEYKVRSKDFGQLHRAAALGDLPAVQRLLQKKHDINELDKERRTPLHFACTNGHIDIVKVLVENKCQLDLCDNDCRSPLLKAVQCQQEACAIHLLEHGADPNIKDVHGNTALHFAVCKSSISVVDLLLSRKACIEAQNEDGSTPLIVAVLENNRQMVDFLLERGASVHAIDNFGRTPLLTAASSSKRDLINVLHQHGADISHRDASGWSAKDYALMSGDTLLMEYISECSNGQSKPEPSPSSEKALSALNSPEKVEDTGMLLGAPATNRDVIDDHSFGDSLRHSGKTDEDSWLSSEDEELDFTPKKPQNPNLAQIMNVCQQLKKSIDEKSSIIRTEPKTSLQQNKSDCQAEDVSVSLPKPLFQVQSFPHAVQPSPGSFPKCSQGTSHLVSKQEESSAEDEDDDHFFSKPGDRNLASNESSQHWNPSQDDVKNATSRIDVDEKEEKNDAESPWDSECTLESPRKPPLDSFATAPTRKMEESCDKKPDESQLKTAKADLKHDAVPHLLKSPKSREKQNADLMEELGLDGADDIEDGSDWDSTSISLGPDDKSFNFVRQKDDATSLHFNYNSAVKSSVTEKVEFSDPQTIAPKDLQHNEPKGIKTFEKDKSKEKNKIGSCNSVEKHENQTVKVEIKYACDEKKTAAVIRSENSNIEYNHFDATNWEERYEKMWVANEKKEVKTNFKSITAELKQLFGENHVDKKICDTYLEKRSQDGFSIVSEDRKESQVSCMSEASIGIEGKSDTGEIKYVIAKKESSTAPSVLYPSSSDSGELPVKPGLKGKPNIKQNWCTDNQILVSNEEGAKINQNEERCDNLFEQPEICKDRRTPSSGKVRTLASGHSSNETVLNMAFKSAYVKQPIVTDNTSMNFVTTKSTRQKTQDHFTNSVNIHKDIDSKSGNNLKNSEQTFHQTPKKELDEELERDIARFKKEVGMLQTVFLALAKEKAQLQKEVEQQKGKQRSEVEPIEINEAENTKKKISLNTEEKMEQKPFINEDHMKTESETSKKSQESNIISARNTKELIPVPLKGKHCIAKVKDVIKNENKRPISKERTGQDDSGSSGASLEERQPAKTATGKDKIHRTVGVKDEFDDFSHSSDTATEDIEFPNLVYGKAMLLLEQLSLESKADSVSLLKIQNIFHGYERLIEDEKGRCSQLIGKVKKLENEKKEQQRRLEDMRETKSTLEHQTTERENVISNLKFSLKQEEEKRKSAEMMYKKNQEQLKKKEEQCSRQMEEKQQLELMLKSLEMEFRTLKKHLKQVEEERNAVQRQLSQEQNARALQEGILNTRLWRQKELEDESRKAAAKQSEITSKHDQGKELLHQNQKLQEELAVLRLELDHVRIQQEEKESRYLEENEALKEQAQELKKELKLNEEALTQTVLQYNGQINVSKTEIAMLTSKLEHFKESKERLEAEVDSFRSRLNSAIQELERCQLSKNDLEKTLQRERDEWLRLKDKLNYDAYNLQEANHSLSQQLSKAESKANSLENELHRTTHTLTEKSLLLERVQKDLNQAQVQVKELENTSQVEKDQMNKYIVKQESMQERLAQLQSENLLLRQQFEDFQNKDIIKEKVVSDVHGRFSDIFSKLRADTEKQVQLLEERNKELITTCNNLREQVTKYETEKAEREGILRQLQQELADSLKKQAMTEASLEVSTRYRIDLEEDKQQLQKEIEKIKAKFQESEEQYLQSERRVHDLTHTLDTKEHEINMASLKLQDVLIASSGTNNAVKQLEEHIQRLEIENARLEATTNQQAGKIEILQKDLPDSNSVHSRLEELITGLQSAKINLEEQLHHQVQKQTMLSVTAQDTYNMREEELKSQSKLGIRLSELDREKTELICQLENEKKKVKKLQELKRSVEARLDQEIQRSTELQKTCYSIKKLLKTTKKKLNEYESGESSSLTNFHGEIKNKYSEIDAEVGKLRIKVAELTQHLEVESTRCSQLESTNHELREELSSMKILHKNQEKLEKSKLQLEEEVAHLKHHMQHNVIDLSQMEQYKRDIEERSRQELRQKIEEVNLFLQAQAASQETLEQIRANNNAALKNQLESRIRDLESELGRLKNIQQDIIFQKDSVATELEKYKGLHLEELKRRRALGSKLDRANEKLAEVNTKLLHERHRNNPLLANSFISGNFTASPVLENVQSTPFSLRGGFLNSTGSSLSSRNTVEAYLLKMRRDLEKSITKELNEATAELEAGCARVSPIGSINGSSKNLNTETDPVSKATQEYLDILKKNYMI